MGALGWFWLLLFHLLEQKTEDTKGKEREETDHPLERCWVGGWLSSSMIAILTMASLVEVWGNLDWAHTFGRGCWLMEKRMWLEQALDLALQKPYFMSGDPKDAQGSDSPAMRKILAVSCLRDVLLLPIHAQALTVWRMRRIKGCLWMTFSSYESKLPCEPWHLPDVQVSLLSPPPVSAASLQVVMQWFTWSGDWCNGWT